MTYPLRGTIWEIVLCPVQLDCYHIHDTELTVQMLHNKHTILLPGKCLSQKEQQLDRNLIFYHGVEHHSSKEEKAHYDFQL